MPSVQNLLPCGRDNYFTGKMCTAHGGLGLERELNMHCEARFIIEVNWEGEIIWEWITSEHFDELDSPEEIPIEPVDLKNFRLPGAGASGFKEETVVEGVLPFPTRPDICVDDSKQKL